MKDHLGDGKSVDIIKVAATTAAGRLAQPFRRRSADADPTPTILRGKVCASRSLHAETIMWMLHCYVVCSNCIRIPCSRAVPRQRQSGLRAGAVSPRGCPVAGYGRQRRRPCMINFILSPRQPRGWYPLSLVSSHFLPRTRALPPPFAQAGGWWGVGEGASGPFYCIFFQAGPVRPDA
jgi:hypothetical protein